MANTTTPPPNYLNNLNFGVSTFSAKVKGITPPKVSPVTGGNSGPVSNPDIDPADYVTKTPPSGKPTDQKIFSSRNKESFEARIDQATKTHGVDSAKVARLNRRAASFAVGSERRADNIKNQKNKKGESTTGVGRFLRDINIFDKKNKNKYVGEDGKTKMSRKEKVNETANNFMNARQNPVVPPVAGAGGRPVVGKLPSTQSSSVIAAGSQGKKCTGGRVLNPVTGNCE